MTEHNGGVRISLMLAVPDATAASAWYQRALGATELWNLGSVVGLEVDGAPFFLGEPEANGWACPSALGTTTVRAEIFVDDPDEVISRAVDAGADAEGTTFAITRCRGGCTGRAASLTRSATSGSSATAHRSSRINSEATTRSLTRSAYFRGAQVSAKVCTSPSTRRPLLTLGL